MPYRSQARFDQVLNRTINVLVDLPTSEVLVIRKVIFLPRIAKNGNWGIVCSAMAHNVIEHLELAECLVELLDVLLGKMCHFNYLSVLSRVSNEVFEGFAEAKKGQNMLKS